MLAAVNDYLTPWQLLPMALFVVGWMWAGSTLLRRSLRRVKPDKFARVKTSKCVSATILAGLAGGVAGIVCAFGIKTAMGIHFLALAGVAGAAVMVFMAFLVLFTYFNLSLKETFAISWQPLGAVGALGIVVGVITAVSSYHAAVERSNTNTCLERAQRIYRAMQGFEGNHSAEPSDLSALVKEKYLKDDDLRCPSQADAAVGYFYIPPSRPVVNSKSSAIFICDRTAVHRGARIVCLQNGECRLYEDKEFRAVIEKPENQAFAAALKAAGGM